MMTITATPKTTKATVAEDNKLALERAMNNVTKFPDQLTLWRAVYRDGSWVVFWATIDERDDFAAVVPDADQIERIERDE